MGVGRALLGLSVVVAVGCGDSSSPPCRVVRDACRFGLLSASCGAGAAAPTFACDPADGRCAWFGSACVAEGFEPSPCPASDVCCVDGYPFDASWREPVVTDSRVHSFLYAWGTAPWDDAREANVVVAVDPTLSSEPLAMTCSGTAPEILGPCDPAAMLRAVPADDVTFALSIVDGRGNLGGWNLSIELVGERARVCRAPWGDGVAYRCAGLPGPDCATSGTLVLSRDPSAGTAGARGHLDVSLASGTLVRATF